jgi:hypothetical protein
VSDKIEQFWRDATPDDVAEIVKTGKTREARFRDNDISNWVSLSLTGFRRESGYDWLDCNYVGWRFCQVYDPPVWYINKPDPGEGWRLLEKFPPEEPQEGDQAKHYEEPDEAWVTLARGFDPGQKDWVWYRRRIANNPEIPDGCNSSETPKSCRSRDTIPSGWRVLGKDEWRLASDAYWSLGCKEWIVLGDDRVGVANELPKWHAIRQVDHQADYTLLAGFSYTLPNGQTIRVTAKGFEVE